MMQQAIDAPSTSEQRLKMSYEGFLSWSEEATHSVLPDFWFHPDWLLREPLPDSLTVLAEIRGLSPEVVQALRATLIGDRAS